ncbi:MAG: hypothetical protein H6569_03385 [Lewinellaceae bacterium]|nr:hypothetical protein [Lewinellaceae bacterium]
MQNEFADCTWGKHPERGASADLTKMPHSLIAGATGRGKSAGNNVILNSLLYKKHLADHLILIDPRKSGAAQRSQPLSAFCPTTRSEPIVTETTKVVQTLNSLIIEMETRYDLLKSAETRTLPSTTPNLGPPPQPSKATVFYRTSYW